MDLVGFLVGIVVIVAQPYLLGIVVILAVPAGSLVTGVCSNDFEASAIAGGLTGVGILVMLLFHDLIVLSQATGFLFGSIFGGIFGIAGVVISGGGCDFVSLVGATRPHGQPEILVE